MITTRELIALIGRLSEGELETWIAADWVRPARREGDWRFSEADVARVRLICEMRRDMAVDEEAVPLVLSLLDQLYGARSELHLLARAIARQPEPVQQDIHDTLARLLEE